MIGYTPVEEDIRALSAVREPPPPPSPRQLYIDGLRVLASILESRPEVKLPYHGSDTHMTLYFLSGDDPRADLAAAARAIPCDWRKSADDYTGSPSVFHLAGELGGLRLQLTAYRDAVCTRVVTGTREVTEKVKDPEKLAEVPEIEVTRTVEDVTWDCGSLLAPRLPEPAPKAVAA
jgi:hypothetical protein